MRKLFAIIGITLLAAGCATVGQVKDLETRVNDLEKKVAKVEGKTAALDEKVGNFGSRIASLEENYKIVYDELNIQHKSKNNETDLKKTKSVK